MGQVRVRHRGGALEAVVVSARLQISTVRPKGGEGGGLRIDGGGGIYMHEVHDILKQLKINRSNSILPVIA